MLPLYPPRSGLYRNHSICADWTFGVQPATFIDLTLDYHIWHMGLSPWEDVYSWSRYNFDIKVKFIGFLTWDCVWTIAFLSVLWHTHTIFCTRLISMGRCVTYIYDFDLWSPYQNCIFHYEFASGQDCLCSLTYAPTSNLLFVNNNNKNKLFQFF